MKSEPKSKHQPAVKQIRVQADLADLMSKLAALESDGNAVEYLSNLLRPVIQKEMVRAAAHLNKMVSESAKMIGASS